MTGFASGKRAVSQGVQNNRIGIPIEKLSTIIGFLSLVVVNGYGILD